MIGKAYWSVLPYFDRLARAQKFKRRPCLIIGQADSGDYVILPISSVSDRTKVDPVYDIRLDPVQYPFLKKECFLRTHKQTIVNLALLRDELADFKGSYEETYLEALARVEKIQKQLIQNAI